MATKAYALYSAGMDGEYWAFLSYSSKDDAASRRFHRRLESYRLPRDLVGRPGRDGPVPRRLFPVFRDREELPLSSDLGTSIEDALRRSRYLVVLCSPAAARSRWVNEEIRYFKSLGREDRILAVLLSGEPNASDDPARAHLECFPPALRHRADAAGRLTEERTEPVGGDVRPGGDGWRRALLKAVAGATGIGFDAFVRRDERRKRRRRIFAGVLAAAALYGGFRVWDYNRLQTALYADFATRWGIPEGIGELTGAEARGRDHHYVLESRRSKVRRILRLNGRGTKQSLNGDPPAAVYEYVYREDGSLDHVDVSDDVDHVLLRRTYSALTHEAGRAVHYMDFRSEHRNAPLPRSASEGSMGTAGRASERKSEITTHRIEYDSVGRPIEVRYLNAYGAPRAGAGGAFGQRKSYGASLLPTRVASVSVAGEVQADDTGVAAVNYDYDRRGDLVRQEYFAAGGERVLGPFGYATRIVHRDAYGNIVREEYVGADGRPCVSKWGSAVLRQEFDDRGSAIRQSYWGTRGEPVLRRDDDYHEWRSRYDADGRLAETSYWGVLGEPAFAGDGFHRVEYHRDARGRVVRKDFRDDRGLPCPAKSVGACSLVWTYGDGPDSTSLSCFGADGKPVLGEDAQHQVRWERDEAGRVLRMSFFDEALLPCNTRSWAAHRIDYEYDERGNEVQEAYFDEEGRPTVDTDGAHRIRRTFDERGNRVQEAYFGASGEPVEPSGAHRLVSTYDARGNETSLSSFGADGKPMIDSDGTFRIEYRHDDRGNVVLQECFGIEGEPVLDTDWGVHAWRSRYDDLGHLLERSFFGIDGKPALHKEWKHHRFTQAFDARGNETDEAYWGVDGEAVPDENGYHRVHREFDDRGREVAQSFFGPREEPVLDVTTGAHRITMAFDARDNEVGRAWFGTAGEPVARAVWRVHRLERTFDARDHLVEERYFGPDGKPALYKGGYHVIRQTFDARGDEVSEAYFGTAGEPVLHPESRFHLQRLVVDVRGHVVQREYFGTDGVPVLGKDGYHRLTCVFDARGKETEWAYFGVRGEPVLRIPFGVHRYRQVFDRLGRLVEKASFGPDGNPVPDVDGYLRVTTVYDAMGEPTKTGHRPDGTTAQVK